MTTTIVRYCKNQNCHNAVESLDGFCSDDCRDIIALRAELAELREASPYEFEWMEKHNAELAQMKAERDAMLSAIRNINALAHTDRNTSGVTSLASILLWTKPFCE